MGPRKGRRAFAVLLFFLLVVSLQPALPAGASAAPAPAGPRTGPDLGRGDWIGVNPTDTNWSDYTVDVDFTVRKEAASVYFRARSGPADSYMWQVNVTGPVPVLKKHVWAGGGVAAVSETPIGDVIGPDALHTPHHLRITADGDTITTSVDGVAVDTTQESAYAEGTIGFRESPTEEATYRDLTVTSTAGKTLLDDPFTAGEHNAFGAGTIGADGLDVANADAMLQPDARTPGCATSSRCGRRSGARGCTPPRWASTR